MRIRIGAAMLLLAAVTASYQAVAIEFPCGKAGCEAGGGVYHIALPDGSNGPLPAVMFFHGYGGQAERLMRDAGLAKAATDRGYAVIAPQGVKLPGRQATNWTVPNEEGGGSSSGRDDVAFVAEVLKDSAGRFAIDPSRSVATGFSLGGMFVWHLACRHGTLFAAYAPVAGVIWEPAPVRCESGPVPLFHTHGFQDKTVPLEGRPVGGGRIVQGDVFQSLDVIRKTNQCRRDDPARYEMSEAFQCRIWDGCVGPEIRFCLHAGGHGIPKGWATMLLDWAEAQLKPAS